MIQPVRIQRKRTRGYNMQAESIKVNGLPCVSCTRPGKYGNQFWIGKTCIIVPGFIPQTMFTIEDCLVSYAIWLDYWLRIDKEMLEPLRNKNLACFCKLSDFCHVDLILTRLYAPL